MINKILYHLKAQCTLLDICQKEDLQRVFPPLDRKMENVADKSRSLRHQEWDNCMDDLPDLERTADLCRQIPTVRESYR